MNTSAVPYPSFLRRRQSGFSLIEAVVCIFILTTILFVVYRVTAESRYHSRFVQPETAVAIDATRNATLILQSMAEISPSGVAAQLQAGRVIPIPGGADEGPTKFVVSAVTADGPNSYLVSTTYTTPAGRTGTAVIPIHLTGLMTTGCAPASGVTLNCRSYVVPAR